MCEINGSETKGRHGIKEIPIAESAGMALAHDITEIRKDEFKGRAFKKGHVIKEDDISHLQRIGKENLFVLDIADDEMHEDDAAYMLASALMGEGLVMEDEPKEGKINMIAARDGILKIDTDALFRFNLLGDVMCATMHNNSVVARGQLVAGTRAIPLVVKKRIVEDAARIADGGIIAVKQIRRPKVGVVITGNEVYYGRIKDAFAPIIKKKIETFHGEIVGLYYAPDDEEFIEARLRELIEAGADLLITTGGMSVDPDDITRFAIRRLGASDITYGSPVLPGAMFLIAYIDNDNGLSASTSTSIPILGIPACGMYFKTTILDLVLPRALAGERIGRAELAELGHGGLCLNCKICTYPVCPFGK
ncbi:MAG: molybdopterin-binding protein [Nitrospirae bacterium]|nr:molybdopterin-binding protein [Nitrospirota bacterium]